MKKSITLLFVLCSAVSFAQGLRFLQENKDVTETTITEKITATYHLTKLRLYNSANEDKKFIFSRIVKSKLLPGYYFAGTLHCSQYPPKEDSTFTFYDTVQIKALHYLPESSNACSGLDVYLSLNSVCREYLVSFIAQEIGGSSTRSEVTIRYVCPNGITDESLPAIVTRVYPNPATDFVSFDYIIQTSFKQSTLVITDVLGKHLKEIRLTDKEGNVKINISDLPNGFYTYLLLVDEQVTNNGKLMIHPLN